MALFQPDASALHILKSTAKTIVITGGSSGIGLTTATFLSSLNPQHNLVLIDLQSPPLSFKHDPSHLLVHTCNITSWNDQRAGFEKAYERFGGIDYVFVNAGISEYGDQFFTDELDGDGKLKEPDKRVLKIDLDAASDTTRLAIHYLRKNSKGGSIVLTASFAGYLASSGFALYSAAKHGLVGLMRALKGPCSKHHISISIVAPGITITPLIKSPNPSINQNANLQSKTPSEYAADMVAAGVPINKPESVALAVCWLFNEGMKANGMGVFVQKDKFVDFESGLAGSRSIWMGREVLDDFRRGRNTPLFKKADAKAKI